MLQRFRPQLDAQTQTHGNRQDHQAALGEGNAATEDGGATREYHREHDEPGSAAPMTAGGIVARPAEIFGTRPRRMRSPPVTAVTWRLTTPVKFTSPTFCE
jgi:hypothetical protein